MKQISALELYYLLEELRILEDQRVDNFYLVDGVFYIRVYVKGKGHKYLVNKVSKYLYLADQKDDASEPSNFIQYLRKYLKNGIVQKVEVIENERILRLTISKKLDDKIVEYYLYFELFANGNIIVCDSNNIIKNSLEKRKFKDRDLLVHREYQLPPKRELSIFAIDKEKMIEVSKEDPLSLVKFLAIKFGLGGKISEEVCFLAGVDKEKSFHEVEEQDKVIEILESFVSKKIDAHGVYNEDEKLVDFLPFEFRSIKKKLAKATTFNALLEQYFSQFKDDIDQREKDFEKQLKKLQNRLEKLQTQKDDIVKDYDKYNGLGNLIYENYQTVEDLLKAINDAGKEKGWKSVHETIKSDERLNKIVKKLNEKNNEIMLNL